MPVQSLSDPDKHKLVPEILRMMPIFAALGAKEEAQRLCQRLLSVSMGPTWYKEDQLGILTEVLDVQSRKMVERIRGK